MTINGTTNHLDTLLTRQQAAWQALLFIRSLPHAADVDEAWLASRLAVDISPLVPGDVVDAFAGGVTGDIRLAIDPGLDATRPPAATISLDAYLSHDIFSPAAQSILNRAMTGARRLSASARRAFKAALKLRAPTQMAAALVTFLKTYRQQLAALLGQTSLAAVLEGAREVANRIPDIPVYAGTAQPPPPTLEPDEARQLIDDLRAMPDDASREARIYQLTASEQQWVRGALPVQRLVPSPPAASLVPPIVPPGVSPGAPAAGGEELPVIHFPTIEEAIVSLQTKNVMDRSAFDALDAASRAKAFTVAGIDAETTLRRVVDSLAANVREGADYDTWRVDMAGKVDAGEFLGDGHMENVFRTNVQAAFSDGQAKVLSHPFVRRGFPYAVYDAIHDDRVRENHLALETLGIQGTNVYRIDDPVFLLFRPPWDFMDRCSWTPITIRQAAARGIAEAIEWLATGVEPATKAYVQPPAFRPPAGFQRAVGNAPLAIRLSLVEAGRFLTDQPPTTT